MPNKKDSKKLPCDSLKVSLNNPKTKTPTKPINKDKSHFFKKIDIRINIHK